MDNLSLSDMYVHGEILSVVASDQQRIPCKNKREKSSDALVFTKETIQEPFDPRKRAKEDTITDVEKYCPK